MGDGTVKEKSSNENKMLLVIPFFELHKVWVMIVTHTYVIKLCFLHQYQRLGINCWINACNTNLFLKECPVEEMISMQSKIYFFVLSNTLIIF